MDRATYISKLVLLSALAKAKTACSKNVLLERIAQKRQERQWQTRK